MKGYVIGSLANPAIPAMGNALRAIGIDAFDDWYGAGREADKSWQEYEKLRGRDYVEALHGRAATHIFDFDYRNLNDADFGVLVMPAGKSGHLELGYLIGQGKPGYIVLAGEPDRYDLMSRFTIVSGGGVFRTQDDFLQHMTSEVL